MARKALWRFASNFGVGLGRARWLFCIAIAHFSVVAVLSADSISYNFSIFDIPENNDTRATGINNAGEVVGSSADAGIVRSFLRSADGSFTFFTVPGVPNTLARDINDLDQIVGSFFDPEGPHAFLRDTDGTFRMLDAPGYPGTSANSINNLGQIAGFVEDSFGVQHGFLLSEGGYTYFDVPAPGGTLGTAAWGINNASEIVGSYISATDERDHGFIRNAAGDSYLLFDFPGSIITDAFGINDNGQVVGSYVSNAQHGFVRCPDGTYLSVDAPGSDGGFNQNFFGINNDGQISGLYLGLNGNLVGYHGFIATPDAVAPEPGIALGQGFWKNHPDTWPVTSLSLGSQSYTQAEMLALFETPPGGDASPILARQLIAAKLNVANGSNPAPISSTIADADNLLSQFPGKLPYTVMTSSAIGQQMLNDANVLDRYNNGDLTPACQP